MTSHAEVPPTPTARVVLLGASNLRLGLRVVVQHALAKLDGPLEFYVAHGFGRSYGRWSSIPGRALPGITQCELWGDVQRSPSLPTFAMLTDVGNDLLYGVSPSQLAHWVGECVDRLRACNAQIVIAELPMDSILRTSSLRFKIFRTIFFPPSQLSFDDACQLGRDVNSRLRALAMESDCTLVATQKEWYGMDPIHIRRRFRRTAWQTAVDAWKSPGSDCEPRYFSMKNHISVELATPQKWRILGCERGRAQPVVVLSDGSTLSVY